MTPPFETTAGDIEALTDVQLTQLVHRLLILEAENLGLPKRRVDVSLKIDTPDGGEDGRLEWQGGPDPGESHWITRRISLFQIKATNMPPSKCGAEVLVEKNGSKSLKPQVQDVVDRAGAYVLCYSRSCAGIHVTNRVDEFRKAFAEVVGHEKADDTDILVYGAERLATWANDHASAVAFVLTCLGRNLPAQMQTWASWESTSPSPLTYHPDKARDDIAAELRRTLREPGGVGRLVGLSGLGKSRMALELFRPPPRTDDDPEQAALSAACVYVGEGADSAESTRGALLDLFNRKVRALVVVDECPLDLHEKLQPIVSAKGSKLSLLTLDFDPSSDPRSARCRFFRLEPLSNDRMTELLKNSHTGTPDLHLSRIADFAQGFPRMAHFLVEAIKTDRTHLWDLLPSTAVERIVVRRVPDHKQEAVLRVAKALAIFEHLGVDGVAAHELEVFAQHVCELPHAEVHAVLRQLERAGVAYRRGDFVRITPLPIAVALAGQWWDDQHLDRARELLLGGLLTPEMLEATANQIKRLSGHDWVDRLVANLYGPSNPFRERDHLDSAIGSRLASSLAEVNPRAVCDALTHAFATMTPEEARTVQAGRRHLVWCLEKLAWWPETFQDAAWLLLLFAAGENESWGNNATNQFIGLFHIMLGGTEMPASDRLAVLQRGIAAKHPLIERVVIKALGGALESVHFARMGGSDAQGGRFPRRDWTPKTYGEIWGYWRDVIQMLRPYLLREDDLGKVAREALGQRVRGMISSGAIAVVEEAVGYMKERLPQLELLDGIRVALNYDGAGYADDLRLRVSRLVDTLTPADLRSRLQATVTKPSWNELRKDEDGHVVMVAEERAEALGRDLAADLDALIPFLPSLLRGEQRQGYKFGRALGEAVADPLGLLRKVVQELTKIPETERSLALATGLAEAASSRALSGREYVRGLLHDPATRALAVHMLLAIAADDDDVAEVVNHLRQRNLPSMSVYGFCFGGALDPLQPSTVAELIDASVEADENGPFVALELLGMRSHRRSLEPELLSSARKVLLRPGLHRLIRSRAGGLGEHNFKELAKSYLRQSGDEGFVTALTMVIVESLSDEVGGPATHECRELMVFLLEHYPDFAWPVLRDALEHGGGRLFLRIGFDVAELDIVGLVGPDRLLAWCESFDGGRHWVARMANPLREKDEAATFPSWSPFALLLLEKYGSDPDVRSALAARIYSGAWSGSAVPRLTRHRDAFKELSCHQNPVVVRWALDLVAAIEQEIVKERKRDEEREFGIFR